MNLAEGKRDMMGKKAILVLLNLHLRTQSSNKKMAMGSIYYQKPNKQFDAEHAPDCLRYQLYGETKLGKHTP